MKVRYGKERQAVAPVLATLLMIAVAVAMSVIIFMWSQGFLSNTSGATGSQQGAQNQAAQSSISIETAVFTTGATSTITIIIRNVGAVTVTLGSVQVSGSSSNSAFIGSVLNSDIIGLTATDTDSLATWTSAITPVTAQLGKGAAGTLILTRVPGSVCTSANAGCTSLTSGDVTNIKVTTNVGTFASAQYTVQ